MSIFSVCDYPEELKKIREEGISLAAKIREVAEVVDSTDEWDAEVESLLRKPPYSLHGPIIPKKYGGRELSILQCAVMMEELAYASLSMATICEIGLFCSLVIRNAGNEEQKQKYLTAMASGEKFAGIMLTDSGPGSDAGSMTTTAVWDGDGYVLNGEKRLVSGAERDDFFLVFAKTNPGAARKSTSAFIIDKGTPGVELGDKQPCFGVKGHQTWQVLFKDCKVPKEALLGEEGHGMKYVFMSLDDSRPTLAAGYMGVARAAADFAIQFAKERKVFGKRLIDNQGIRWQLLELKTEIEAARFLCHKACYMADQKKWHKKETSMAKYYAAELMVKAANLALRVCGGDGSTDKFIVQRLLRDAHTFAFAQGSPEIQKVIASREMFD